MSASPVTCTSSRFAIATSTREHEPHVLFQASTIAALLDGAYDGDVTFAELAEHGDLGLGTLNALDGEMIALDGRFYRADVDGLVARDRSGASGPRSRPSPGSSPRSSSTVAGPLDHGPARAPRRRRRRPRRRLRAADRRRVRVRAGALGAAPAAAVPAARRGRRRPARVRAPPDVAGSLVGFRFPGLRRGRRGRAATTSTSSPPTATAAAMCSIAGPGRCTSASTPPASLHVELPPGVDLESPDVDEDTKRALDAIERGD